MRIVLAEDNALLRAGLTQLLTAARHEVTAVSDADELLAVAADAPPDVVVSDIRMPPTMTDDGLRAAAELRRIHAELPVVMLSQYVAAAYLDSLIDAGGFGYLLKDRVAEVEEFLATVDKVAAGGTVVDPEVVTVLLRRNTSGIASLTERETEVLQLMAEGLSNTQIAEKLYLSAGAVSKNVAAVFMKLGFTPEDDNRRVRAVLKWLRANPA
ncbi:response regulator transcription factor [Corynebacterium ulceribovis]|uniref:response regulator transcription factor n=1 Tax=Corynebacterium ulceribovis TaxID=487732 RepID=UPI00036D9CFE|nr:response regulator transcription factor [Corynebacterium ulceribovis]